MSYRPCDKCVSWKNCPGYNYYEPREIRFCYHQVIFLITNLSLLEEGIYPLDPTPTGYTGAGSKPQYRAGGKFQMAADYFSEIDWRLKRTGIDGRTLKHEIQTLNANYYNLSGAAMSALIYVAGWKRKRRYGKWFVDRKFYQQKLRQKVVIAEKPLR